MPLRLKPPTDAGEIIWPGCARRARRLPDMA
jgi:hypothetical protein